MRRKQSYCHQDSARWSERKKRRKACKEHERFLFLPWSAKDPSVPSWASEGKARPSPVCQPSENSSGKVPSWNTAGPCSLTSQQRCPCRQDLSTIWTRKECRITTDSPFSFTVTTKLGGTDIKAPEATLKTHLHISWIVGSVSDNIMITTGPKEEPECLKADVFQITSFGLTEILLLPTNFSHLYYTCTLDTPILEKFKLNETVSISTGFFYNSYDLTHQSLRAMQK